MPDHGLVIGVPARLRGFVCKCGFKLTPDCEQGDFMRMTCTKCGEAVDIVKKDYDLLGGN